MQQSSKSISRTCAVVFVSAAIIVASDYARAQHSEVRGLVVDTTEVALSGATVVILQPADSSMVSFGITRPDGAFRIERVPLGQHLLQVTFVGFTPHSQSITVGDDALDVGRIVLREDVADLDALIVTADHIPMAVNRDTLEYYAGAFQVAPNATVEDLLRRLPGIEVERDGSITAQGEQVRRVLVDGREFFGDDPTVATRNLPADAVERVQVFDRRSDMAEFTGVDDGDEERTINLSLRPDRRQGYFGNASGGVGDLRRYDTRASINRFSPDTQLSFIANANNVNRQGFGVGDFMNFMQAGRGGRGGGGGGIGFSDAPISRGATSGFSNTMSGGINASHQFRDGTTIRASYIGHYLDHEQDRSILQRQLFGPNAAATTDEQSDQLTRQLSHRLNLNARYEIDAGHDLQLRSNLQLANNDLERWSGRETRSEADQLQNTNLTSFLSERRTLGGDATLTYRRRLAPGRTIAAELSTRLNDSDLSSELESLSEFYGDGNVLTSEELAQLQSQLGSTFSHGQRLTYTEPLGTGQLLQFDFRHRVVHEDQDRAVLELGSGSDPSDAETSTGFERSFRYLTGGIGFRRSVEPLTIRVGVDLQQAHLDGAILQADAAVDSRFLNVLPSASVNYAFSESGNVELRYGTSTREPSMRDLQPFVDNSDPLNVYVGNPDLRPEYGHNLSLRFMRFDPFSQLALFGNVGLRYTLDRIVRVRTVDEFLRQTTTTTNVDGDWSVSASANVRSPIRPLGINLSASNSSVLNRTVEYLNGEENLTNILRSTVNLSLDNRNKDVVDATLGARFTYNDVRYELNPAMNRAYVNSTYFGDVAVSFASTWRARAQLEYNYYAREVFGTAQQVPMLHAELSKLVMNDRGQVVLEVRDILNEGLGVNYSNTPNYIQEERIESLGRYVMLRFVYNLRSGQRPGGGPMRVMGR